MEFDFNVSVSNLKVEKPKFYTDEWEVGYGGSIPSMPAYHKGVLYISSCDRHIYALDYKTKKILWKFKADGIFVESVLNVFDDVIYVGNYDGYFYAVSCDGNLSLIHISEPTRPY